MATSYSKRIKRTNIKALPERGKLPPLHKSKLASKDSMVKNIAAMQAITGLLDDLSPKGVEKLDITVK